MLAETPANCAADDYKNCLVVLNQKHILHIGRSPTVSLYLVLTLSHVHSRTGCLMVSSCVNVSHRLALFRIHAI